MSVVVASLPQILILDLFKKMTMEITVMMGVESVMKEENGITPLNSFFHVSVLLWVSETSGGFPTCVIEVEEVCSYKIHQSLLLK